MKILKALFCLLIMISFTGFAQQENDNWNFGDNASVNFALGGPVATSGSQMQSAEGVATLSDNLGQLLFYTDGKTIWDANNSIMPNGVGLTAGPDDIQGVVIVPYPDNPNEYFVFTMNGFGNTVAYSRVDMTANNGFGDVLQLNTPLENQFGNTTWIGRTENITVVSIGVNYRVLIARQDKLLSYLVDDTGVNVTPTQSDINFLATNTFSHLKVSPDKTIVSLSDFNQKTTTLYHYDNISGQVSDSQPIAVIQAVDNNSERFIYSSEFTYDSNYIWLSTFGAKKLFGFNVNDFSQAPIIIDNPVGGVGTVQRGPDDELYVAVVGNSSLAKLINANDPINVSYNPNEVFLNGNVCRLGLPQLIPMPNPCPVDLLLDSPEQNSIFTYESSNSIITTNDYTVAQNQNIVLSSGNYILMEPNTLLNSGSVVLAKIEGCTPQFVREKKETEYLTISLGDDEKVLINEELILYPNPVMDELNIILESSLLNSVVVRSMFGVKLIQTSNINLDSYSIDLSTLKKGLYVVTIESISGNLYTRTVIKE